MPMTLNTNPKELPVWRDSPLAPLGNPLPSSENSSDVEDNLPTAHPLVEDSTDADDSPPRTSQAGHQSREYWQPSSDMQRESTSYCFPASRHLCIFWDFMNIHTCTYVCNNVCISKQVPQVPLLYSSDVPQILPADGYQSLWSTATMYVSHHGRCTYLLYEIGWCTSAIQLWYLRTYFLNTTRY